MAEAKLELEISVKDMDEVKALIAELTQRAESAEQRVKELEAEVMEEIENRDNREEWLDKICKEIARFFNVDIGEHSSANNPWLEALELIPDDTLNKFAIEQRIEAFDELASENTDEDAIYMICQEKIEQLRAKLGDE